ncbi:MAG: hypothetical protein KatS3mg096_571 [Candidatus Parcubacteria bacterium]|nr:MAG: hypothetical protein KatS3mg095_0949 [Candidatus Parcubacteria bacterium]GIW67703.1 MAG: hypothetical protein KatS3mg096_571 [Candidatus Parcubacteria bacterium]
MNKHKLQRIYYERQQIIKILFLSFLILFSLNFTFAHTEDAELNAEIQKGRELVEKFSRGEIKCQNLTNEDFHSVGEYVMEQMVGGSDHLTMNKMIEQMHGKEGEELMHINMGKRFLGCDVLTSSNSTRTNANNFFMMPMHMWGSNFPMFSPYWMNPSSGMGYWQGWWNFANWRGWNVLAPIFGILGFLWLLIILSFPVLVLILLILGIIYMLKKLRSEIKKE